jgi:pyrroline-5-carboxylate reductase
MYGFEKAIKKIASKKGTTEAGLVTLHKLGGNKMLNETFKATKIRSQEIENEFK